MMSWAACRFWAFVFIFMLAHQFALSLFRAIAAITRSLILAYPLAWLVFLTILLLGGFILNKRAAQLSACILFLACHDWS